MESYKLYNEHLSNPGLKFSPRGSEADLFTPTPTAVANAPAAATAHYGGAPPHPSVSAAAAAAAIAAQNSNHFQSNQAMLSHLATQLAPLGTHGAPNANQGMSLPHGYGLSSNNSTINMYSQVPQFAGNDAKKVKLDNFSNSGLGPHVFHGNGAGVNAAQSQQQQLNQAHLSNIAGSAPPSKYVAICNLPEGTTQAEIIGIGANDGKITAAAVMENKHQGYLEFEEERSAISMVARCRNSPPVYRGNQLSVTFGSAKDMKSMVNTTPTFMNTNHSAVTDGSGSPDLQMGGGNNMSSMKDERTVLRVIVEMGENQNIYNQVNLEVLHHLFSRTGFVMKIITFAKPGYPQQFQALIQYMEAKSAQTAKELFDGQNLYYGCCPLKMEYSKLTNLNVKYNNEKSRDFTRPDLPTGENSPIIPAYNDQTALALAQGMFHTQFQNIGAGANQYGAAMNPANLGHIALSQSQYLDPNFLFYSLTNGIHPSMSAASLQSAALLQQLQRGGNPGAQLSLPTAGNQSVNAINNVVPANSVLLVGNLNTDKVTCDGLFTLFGVYGDVQRVKILFNKQDSALIQMSSEPQANLAIENLNEVRVYGREMRVSLSKHQLVQLPKEGQPDAGLTKDYSNSPLHRFRKQGSKNFQNIYPPSSTLHLSNIAPGATEDQVLEAFIKKNIEVISFRFFPDPDDNDHKMALLQCRSKEDAVIALIEGHNYQLGENHHLRVSFSKTQMGGMSSIGGSNGNGVMLATPSAENSGTDSLNDSSNRGD